MVGPARRVRHGQAGGDRFGGGHVEHRSPRGGSRAPPGRGVGGRHHGDECRGSVAQRQPVQVTAVLRGQVRDEPRPPARNEAVPPIDAGQAGEQRVHHPQVGLAVVGVAPGNLVAADVAAGDRSARQPTAVVAASRLDRRRQLRVVAQEPDLSSAGDGDPVAGDGDAHGLACLAGARRAAPRGFKRGQRCRRGARRVTQ